MLVCGLSLYPSQLFAILIINARSMTILLILGHKISTSISLTKFRCDDRVICVCDSAVKTRSSLFSHEVCNIRGVMFQKIQQCYRNAPTICPVLHILNLEVCAFEAKIAELMTIRGALTEWCSQNLIQITLHWRGWGQNRVCGLMRSRRRRFM